MNLKHLAFVESVGRLGSFSRAAAECNVTQPTLSSAVNQIEELFGAALFERTTRSVAPTPFGKQLLPAILAVLNASKELSRNAAALLEPSIKMLRVGLSPIVDMAKVMATLDHISKQHPDVEIHFKECFLDDLAERLQAETIDIAIWPLTRELKSNLESVILYRDPWVFVPASSNSAFAPNELITLEDIANDQIILTAGHCGLAQATRQMFGHAGLSMREYPGKPISYQAVQEWADLGIGSGLLPASKVSARQTSRVMPLMDERGNAAQLDISVTWKSDAPAPAHLRALKKHLRSLAKSHWTTKRQSMPSGHH